MFLFFYGWQKWFALGGGWPPHATTFVAGSLAGPGPAAPSAVRRSRVVFMTKGSRILFGGGKGLGQIYPPKVTSTTAVHTRLGSPPSQ